MKRFLSRLVNSLPKRIAAGAIIALAVALPVAASAAQTVTITSTTGVANVTNGAKSFTSSTSATYNQQVEIEVSYDNTEAAGSGKTANNLRVKINIPTTAGATQKVTTTTSADNSNTLTGTSTISLDNASEYLEYIPGSASWEHETSANSTQTTTTAISDSVVTGSNGLVLENENPCQGGVVTVHALVVMPGVSVTKQSELASQSNQWSANNTAQPGDTMKYMITYKNTGNTGESNVIIRDLLPKGLTYVPGSTMLYDTSYPNGIAVPNDDIVQGGENIGGYVDGGNAYVVFQAKIADASQLSCGENTITNNGFAQPSGMAEYYATAATMVNNTCSTPTTPTYSCGAFTVTVGTNRQVAVSKFGFSASDNSTLGSATLNWGDNSTPLVTNNVQDQTHTFAQDGTYNITLSNFKVNGNSVNVTGTCSQQVTISTPTTPPTNSLPNTGAGDVVGIGIGAVAAGIVAAQVFLRRKTVNSVK